MNEKSASLNIYLEMGKKKTFANALDWPGWSRAGKNKQAAIQSLLDYGSRYIAILRSVHIGITVPIDRNNISVIEQLVGNSTTDFGAPAVIPGKDHKKLSQEEFVRFSEILQACWDFLDTTIECASSRELKKGPRGGGRILEAIIHHVIEADRAYLRRIAWTPFKYEGMEQRKVLTLLHKEITKAVQAAADEGLPEKGPRGGVIWPLQYFFRRSTWHILDHAWEIEDRII